MRAAPAIHVFVSRFGVWRWAVGLSGTTAAIVAIAWVSQHLSAASWPSAAGESAVGAAAFLGIVWLTVALVRVPAFQLRWDGLSWYFNPVEPTTTDAVAADAQAGELSIAIDLGAWLLLRFTPDTPIGRARARWLPVQRDGLDRQWHGLRCALYSPRPVAGRRAATKR